ncbi:MAG: DUF975 family protein [Clostridia bacterium]|nr:DUF975 family protein [Clostridia bacterium]
MNRAELKSAARSQIKGKIGILFLITLIISAISGVASGLLSLIPGGGIIASVVITPAFALSIVRVYLNIVKGGTPAAGDAFSGFDDFWSAFKVQFFTGLFTFLWSLLFVIPGIVKGYAYSMSMYVLADNPGKPALECIRESQNITNGHKMDLFVLHLSFIGWVLLSVITCGIAYIWVGPYMSAAYANAYNSLKPVVEVQVEEPVIEE